MARPRSTHTVMKPSGSASHAVQDGLEQRVHVAEPHVVAVRQRPVPERQRGDAERAEHERHGDHAEREADDGVRDQPREVTPHLRVAQRLEHAGEQAGGAVRAVVPADGTTEDERRVLAIQLGRPAHRVRRAEHDRQADDQQAERQREGQRRHPHRERGDRGEQRAGQVGRVASRAIKGRKHAEDHRSAGLPEPCGPRASRTEDSPRNSAQGQWRTSRGRSTLTIRRYRRPSDCDQRLRRSRAQAQRGWPWPEDSFGLTPKREFAERLSAQHRVEWRL